MKKIGITFILLNLIFGVKASTTSYANISEELNTSLRTLTIAISTIEQAEGWQDEENATNSLHTIENYINDAVLLLEEIKIQGTLIKDNAACFDVKYYGRELTVLAQQAIIETNEAKEYIAKALVSIENEGLYDLALYQKKITKYLNEAKNEANEAQKALTILKETICKTDPH